MGKNPKIGFLMTKVDANPIRTIFERLLKVGTITGNGNIHV